MFGLSQSLFHRETEQCRRRLEVKQRQGMAKTRLTFACEGQDSFFKYEIWEMHNFFFFFLLHFMPGLIREQAEQPKCKLFGCTEFVVNISTCNSRG